MVYEIKFENVSFSYMKSGKVIVKNITKSFNINNIYIITGENGAGKTTFLKLCMSILKPHEGEIFINKKSSKNLLLNDVAKDIFFIFQDFQKQLFCETVFEEVAFALKYKGYSEKEIEITVNEALNKSNIYHLKERHPLNLSFGEKQRLIIACALAIKPKIIIMDEPTSHLDKKNTDNLINILKQLSKENFGIILSSHDEYLRLSLNGIHLELKEGELHERS